MSNKKDLSWKTYEEIAALVLNQCAAEFGIERVEGKQGVVGKSGTEWEVDARAWTAGSTAHLLVECKKHAKTGISQAITGSLAYQIQDTNAEGGFLVSPKGLQSGAKKVAAAANIHEIKLDPRSTIHDPRSTIHDPRSTPSAWFGEWLGKLRVGLTDEVKVGASDHLLVKSIDEDGKETIVHDSAKGDTKKL